MSSPLQVTYVMGQLNVQLSPSQIEPLPISSHETGQRAEIECWLPPPPLILNLRFDHVTNCPIRPRTEQENAMVSAQLRRLGWLYDDMQCDLSQQVERRLSADQVKIIQQTSGPTPNVMLFIHGYNVPMGEYGQQIYTHQVGGSTACQVPYQSIDIPQTTTDSSTFYLSDQPATIFRDPACYDKPLNGDGAHHWWLRMEYILNQAAGFEGFSFFYQPDQPHYTRLLNIAWSGDPLSPLDYMAVEPMAKLTARALLPAIEQLVEAGIEINVIAHSAGNIVLVQLMALLAEQSSCKLNQVFLWQAAMPDTVLSPHPVKGDPGIAGSWQTQHAYQSAHHITVLFSRHDNILGPIPLMKGKKSPALNDKWRAGADGPSMASLALAVDVLDETLGVPNALKSCYHVAQLFHMPFNVLMFDHKSRVQAYQYLRDAVSDRSTLMPSLSQQVEYIAIHYGETFETLSAFISLYAAIKHDGILVFLANRHDTAELAEYLVQLAPWQAALLLKNTRHAFMTAVAPNDRQIVERELAQFAIEHAGLNYLHLLWRHLRLGDEHMQQWARAAEVLWAHPYCMLDQGVMLTVTHWYRAKRYLQRFSHRPSILMHQDAFTQRGCEVAALVISVLNTSGLNLRPAMGYSGVDVDDPSMHILLQSGRIQQVDQTDILFYHGAMRDVDTSSPVFKRVYQSVIMNAPGLHFVRW